MSHLYKFEHFILIWTFVNKTLDLECTPAFRFCDLSNKEAGFKLVDAKEFAVDMHKEAWEYISAFQQYAAGALRGYPIDDAVNAMRDSVGPAIELHGNIDQDGKPYITRKWLAISAQA